MTSEKRKEVEQKRREKKKKDAELRKKENVIVQEKTVAQLGHMEPRRKKRHDFNAGDDNVKLSKMLEKARKSKQDKNEGQILPKLPADVLMQKRVIRGKIISERWMLKNGLEKLFDLIKWQKWEKLFTKRDLVFKTECRKFYKNLTMSITWKKEVAKSRVNGINIEFDCMTLAIILNIPENNGICDYIKEVWEEPKYYKPLEITKKFANDENIVEARRVKSVELQPFYQLL
ncbi:hypothetical protein Dimus_035898 [Dionaea muscipula]